jgi:hypothetical protein
MPAGLPDQAEHLTGLGVSSLGLLREHAAPIDLHLEHTTGGLDQFELRLRIRLAYFGRQTGGPRLVVSNDAEFDRHAHGHNDSGA